MSLRSAFTVAVLSAVAAPYAQAEILHALRTDNTLVSFDSGTPSVAALQPLTGVAAGETLRSIDRRPADGRYYGLATDAAGANVHLYRIDVDSGVATPIGAAFAVTPASTQLGVDFQPTFDRLRVVNGAGANFRVNPNNGTLTDGNAAPGIQQDTAITGAGSIRDVAYDRSYAGSAATTLFAIDYTNDRLVRIGGVNGAPTENAGVATTIGQLGVTAGSGVVAFDISGPVLHYATRVGGVTNLYSVDIATGAATLVGAIAGNPALTGLAADADMALMTLADEAGSVAGTLEEGDRDHYAVPMPALGRLWAVVDSGGPRNDATASRVTSLRLLQPNFQTEIEQDRGDGTANGEDDTIEGGDAGLIAGRVVATAGHHFLEVAEGYIVASNDDDRVAPYKLTTAITTGSTPEAENNGTPALADPIGSGPDVLVRSATTSVGDEDWYSVFANAGEVLMIAADGNPTRDANNLTQVNIDLQLRGPSPFNEILLSAASSETANDPNEIGEGFLFHVARTGTYFVRVTGSASADYDLMVKTVRRVPTVPETTNANDTVAQAQALAAATGRTVLAGGALAAGGDTDHYRVAASHGARIWAYVDTGGPLNQSSGVSRDSVLTLLTEGGTTIESDEDDGTGNGGDADDSNNGIASVIAGRPVLAGNYVLRVSEAGNDQPIDPYRLFVFVTRHESSEVEPNGAPAQAQAAGTGDARVVNGQIGTLGDVDWYAIDAEADDIVFAAADGDLDRDGTGIDLTLRLYAPDGSTQLISPASGVDSSGASPTPAEGFNFRIIERGRYYLTVAERTNSATGAYRLLVDGPHLFVDGFE